MYEIEDKNAEPIIGKFYENEMSPVGNPHAYEIEKILKRKKGLVLVKWVGYDGKHNSWIPGKDVVVK